MRTITVTGQGAGTAVPDVALVSVSAVHQAPTLVDALAGAESARAAIVTAAGDLLVASADLSVWPRYDGQDTLLGYEARHSLQVRCGDLAAAGELLDRLAVDVGDRLRIDGVSLSVSDPSEALSRGRDAAVADATARAEHLAALLGATLGPVHQVVDGATPGWRSGADAIGVALAARSVKLEPGEATLATSVTVTWDLVTGNGASLQV